MPKRDHLMQTALDALVVHGHYSTAARICGIAERTIFRWIDRSKQDQQNNVADSPFLIAWSEATAYFHEHCAVAFRMNVALIESRARELALRGFEEPVVFQGRLSYVEDETLVGLDDAALAILGLPDRYKRDAQGNRIPLTVHRKPSDQLVLKMLAAHFPRTYGERVEVNSTNMIAVAVFGRDGKLRPRGQPPKVIEHNHELPAMEVEAPPGELKYGLVLTEEACATSAAFDARYGGVQADAHLAEIAFEDDDGEPSPSLAPAPES